MAKSLVDNNLFKLFIFLIPIGFIIFVIAVGAQHSATSQITNPAIRFMNSNNITVLNNNGNLTWIATNLTATAGVDAINSTQGDIGLIESTYINITKSGQNFLFELLGDFVNTINSTKGAISLIGSSTINVTKSGQSFIFSTIGAFVNSLNGLSGVLTIQNTDNITVAASGSDIRLYVTNLTASSGVSSLNSLTGALIVGNYSTAVTSLNGLSGDLTVVNSTNGAWTNPNNYVLIRDDFAGGSANGDATIGELGWSKSGTGSKVDGVANYNGIQRITTSATINSDGNLRLGAGENTIKPTENWNCTFIFRFGANISNIEFRAGMSSGITSDAPTSGVFLQYHPASNPVFLFKMQNGGSNYTEVTDITPAASTWYVIEIKRNTTSQYLLYINDVLKATLAHSPNALSFGFGMNIKNKYALAKTFDIDFFRLEIESLTRNPHSYDTGLMFQGPAPIGNRTDGYYLNDGSFVNFNPNRQSILLFSDLTGCQITGIGSSFNEICPEITRIKVDPAAYTQVKLFGVYTSTSNVLKIQLEGSLNGLNWTPILTSPPLPSNTRKYVESDWFILDPDYQKEGYIRLTIGAGSGTQSATIFKVGLMLR